MQAATETGKLGREDENWEGASARCVKRRTRLRLVHRDSESQRHRDVFSHRVFLCVSVSPCLCAQAKPERLSHDPSSLPSGYSRRSIISLVKLYFAATPSASAQV